MASVTPLSRLQRRKAQLPLALLAFGLSLGSGLSLVHGAGLRDARERGDAGEVPAFGDPAQAGFTLIADAGDGLQRPRDLAFNPYQPEQLWVVNQENDGTVMLERPGTADEVVDARVDAVAFHFMDQVSGIAFAPDNSFATCHESRNDGSGGRGDDFMGPTQWTADLSIYAKENQGFSQAELNRLALTLRAGMCLPTRLLDAPAPWRAAEGSAADAAEGSASGGGLDQEATPSPAPATATLEPDPQATATPRIFRRGGTLGSHIDMLHQSPLCMGIAHGQADGYWVTDGLNGHVVFYDFKVDHGFGGTDHSDGVARRYPDAPFKRVPKVPGHLVLDPSTGWLYYADTGAGKVRRLKVDSGRVAEALKPEGEKMAEFSLMEGAQAEVFIDEGLAEPSGIAIGGGLLYVSDHADGRIHAYRLDDGSLAGSLDTGAKALMGLELGADGRLWYVDAEAEELRRVEPGAAPATATPTPLPSATATPTATPTPSRWWGFLPFLGS